MPFWDDLKKPINLVSIGLAFASVVLAYVFYVKSQKEAVPTYTLMPNQFKIFDSHIATPKITLSNSRGASINDNVYLAEAVFWNSGNLPIEPQDVRSPVRLVLTPCTSILDFKIVKETRSEVGGIRLTEDTSVTLPFRTKALVLKWNHLDPAFGVRFQIIYSGSDPAALSFDGYIVGTDGLLSVPPVRQLRISPSFTIVLLSIAVASIALIAFFIVQGIYPNLPHRRRYILLTLAGLAGPVWMLIEMIVQIRSGPPV